MSAAIPLPRLPPSVLRPFPADRGRDVLVGRLVRVVLYQLLAGHPPFTATRVPRLLSMHLTEEPPRLDATAPLLPPDLVALVHRLLLKDPAQRPTMREVVGELERMQAQRGSASAQSLPQPAAPRLPAEADEHAGGLGAEPRSIRPAREPWERAYSDGRTEGAGDLGQGVNAYEHTLSSGPLPLPRISQHEAGTQVVSPGPHDAPPREAPESATAHLLPQPPQSPQLTITSSAALTSGLHTAPGTGERTPVPSRPHGRWSLFLASLLGGLTVTAAGWILRPTSHGPVAPVARPAVQSVPAAAPDAQLPALPHNTLPAPVAPTPAPPSAASPATGRSAASPATGRSAASPATGRSATSPATGRSPSPAAVRRDPPPSRPKGPAWPAVSVKKPGSDAAPGTARPAPPPQDRTPDAPAKPQFKIID